ncbi:hypothetical protein [Janthinobacterium sp. 75]|uniref:hypothetical protein n=1 Tax=Janthinobacterium sp. 75 TaxID=2135628 RepID=UPI0010625C36|nr:hypothetical protein [Janthinobacterium sp. 75]
MPSPSSLDTKDDYVSSTKIASGVSGIIVSLVAIWVPDGSDKSTILVFAPLLGVLVVSFLDFGVSKFRENSDNKKREKNEALFHQKTKDIIDDENAAPEFKAQVQALVNNHHLKAIQNLADNINKSVIIDNARDGVGSNNRSNIGE